MAELEIRRRRRLKTEGIGEFIPRISPRYVSPIHLAPLLDALERTERDPVRAIVSVPPRHSKTETILHAIAWRLARRPWETIAYVTYGDRLAKSKSRLARQYAQRACIKLRDDAHALNSWLTEEMGGALFTSVGGPLTGQGASLLIIDDPHKDRAEAESSLYRDAVWEWYRGVAYTRVEPGGSIIITHTRWHPEDLTGRVLSEHSHEKWEHVKLQAINAAGEALWPEQWPLSELEAKRASVGEYDWISQFQGEPMPRGGAVFRDVRWYDPAKLPRGLRVTAGIDLAYSGRTKSDYSACVVVGEAGGTIYVLDAARAQVDVPAFANTIKATCGAYPGARIKWHTSTTEQGVAQLLSTMGINVHAEIARADKFTRALPAAAAWNAGKVLLPGGPGCFSPSWVNDFVREVTSFTGQGDRHDDQVDAFASAFEDIGRADATIDDTLTSMVPKARMVGVPHDDWDD